MKVMASVKKMCRNCKVIKRKRVVRVICTDPRHKQRQGYAENEDSEWLVLLVSTARRISTRRSA